MGQQLSSQTQTVINKLPEKVAKHVSLVRESGFLTYEEFLGRLAELNDVTAKLASGQEKHLLFEVQPGSDASALWKVAVRVVCTKINKTSGIVEASRIMNLYQFIQLYKDITSQAAGVLSQNAAAEGAAQDLSSVSPCQASIWMGRYHSKLNLDEMSTFSVVGDSKSKHRKEAPSVLMPMNCKLQFIITSECIYVLFSAGKKRISSRTRHFHPKYSTNPAIDASRESLKSQLEELTSCQMAKKHKEVKQLTDEEECCICMDGRADLILPCAHSFCQKCIDKWSGRHRNCPVCRLQVTAANDSWVVSDAPTEEDIATYILNMVDEAGQPHRP